MSEQRNAIIIAITLALVSVFILGGVSFVLFPSQLNGLTLSEKTSLLSILSSKPQLIPGLRAAVSTTWQLDSICIENDGSLNSTDVPIQREGEIYRFTGDLVNVTLLVQRDNIIIDGNSYRLQGFKRGESSYGYEGIILDGRSKVTVKNLLLTQFAIPILVQSSNEITISNNIFVDNGGGIFLNSAKNSKVIGNDFNQTLSEVINLENGAEFAPSTKNIISNNNITDGTIGISANSGSSNTITWNNIADVYNPIAAGENTIVANNNMINGIDGIISSSYCNVYENTILNFSQSGMSIQGVSSIIFENDVANCSHAILMDSWDEHPLGNNTLYRNNFINNTAELLLFGNASQSINSWDNGKEGNYWSNYYGTDTKTEGIGDTPYMIDANNIDRYPLMQPYVEKINDETMQMTLFTASAVAAVGGCIALTLSIIAYKRRDKSLRTSVLP